MTPMINAIATYLAADPDDLGMEPDATGLPALIGGVKQRWPTVTQSQIAMAIKLGAKRAHQMAALCFAEADALDALAAAKEEADRSEAQEDPQ